jgi:hypothetical protein
MHANSAWAGAWGAGPWRTAARGKELYRPASPPGRAFGHYRYQRLIVYVHIRPTVRSRFGNICGSFVSVSSSMRVGDGKRVSNVLTGEEAPGASRSAAETWARAAIENQDKLHRGVWSVIGALDYSVKRPMKVQPRAHSDDLPPRSICLPLEPMVEFVQSADAGRIILQRTWGSIETRRSLVWQLAKMSNPPTRNWPSL